MEKVIEYLCYHKPDMQYSAGKKFLSRNEMREMAKNMINNTKQYERTNLTIADSAAWWEFLKQRLPYNYERAMMHKKIEKDINIGDLDGIKNLKINDYFELYGLPRVKAENGIISVDGTPVIRYANRMEYFKKRNIFNIARADKRFIYWKREQVKHCQNGRCAWCDHKIGVTGSHVDHVRPLIFFGKNEPWNLVVCCEYCNKVKSADSKGWNDSNNMYLNNKKPGWIKKNKYDALLKKIMIEAEKKYEAEESNCGSVILVGQRATV